MCHTPNRPPMEIYVVCVCVAGGSEDSEVNNMISWGSVISPKEVCFIFLIKSVTPLPYRSLARCTAVYLVAEWRWVEGGRVDDIVLVHQFSPPKQAEYSCLHFLTLMCYAQKWQEQYHSSSASVDVYRKECTCTCQKCIFKVCCVQSYTRVVYTLTHTHTLTLTQVTELGLRMQTL